MTVEERGVSGVGWGTTLPEEHRKRVFFTAGRVRATFLLDGFVRGAWKIEKTRNTATLVVEPFEALSRQDRDDLAGKGERLLRFVAEPGGAQAFGIRFRDTT